ncbi:glycosyltransferase family 4 protein [Albibacterium indicum]|uniref:glycosyltransferase family 4 protein n=1 Tax=Albibacterium indicum TaxID=2292082 RepID=UPI000E4F05D0|nr:glycosyltransferase family 1 protein [Pedobacter indicus]
MRKIKVAFFAEILIDDFDGASRTMFQLINRIPNEEFDFLFIYGKGSEEIANQACFKVPILDLPMNAGYTMALPSMAKAKLKKRLASFSPDVVHIATPSLLGAFALKYARQHALPVISIYHTHFVSYVAYYLRRLPFLIEPVKHFLTDNQRNFYNRCDLVYVPAQSIKTELQDFGILQSKMKLWQRGIDTELFSPKHRDKLYLEKLTGNQHPTILFVSRLVWEKNLETLFRIYELIQKCGRQVNLVIGGDGAARQACIEHMPEAIFTGKVNHQQLATLYASADVFLFPSVSEAYGNVVLEAMASGLPCVIADGGGSKDFVQNGVNGFKCNPYDEHDYLKKILLVLQDDELRGMFSLAGLKYSHRLSWDQLAEVYFNDLQSLTASSKMAI